MKTRDPLERLLRSAAGAPRNAAETTSFAAGVAGNGQPGAAPGGPAAERRTWYGCGARRSSPARWR